MRSVLCLCLFFALAISVHGNGDDEPASPNAYLGIPLSGMSAIDLVDFFVDQLDGRLPDEHILGEFWSETKDRDIANSFVQLVVQEIATHELQFDGTVVPVLVFDFHNQRTVELYLKDYAKLSLISLGMDIMTLTTDPEGVRKTLLLPIVEKSLREYVDEYQRIDGVCFYLEILRRNLNGDTVRDDWWKVEPSHILTFLELSSSDGLEIGW